MDPNATLSMLLQSIANGDHETATEAADNLRQWIDNGGFLPADLQWMADELSEVCAHELQTATGRRETDECHEGDMDFRIVIRPEGNLEWLTGDASYDTDHRGWWGAGVATASDDYLDCAQMIVDEFFAAADSAIESIS